MPPVNILFRLLAVALLIFFLSGQGIPVHSAVWSHPVPAAGLLLLAIWAGTGSRAGRLRRGLDRLWNLPQRRFNLLLFAVAAGAYAGAAWFVFKGIPRIDDGVAALFQARLFARGAVTLPLPPEAGFYEMFGVLGQRAGLGHWCGMYPPGWPLLLTPGVWLGAPWLVNPVLGGLLVVIISELGRAFFNERTGRLAALLAIPSPFMAVLSGLHLSHIPTALACGLCLLSLKKLWDTSRWLWGGVAGLAWGVAFLCRPLDAAVLGAIFAAGFLIPPERLWRCRLGIAAGLAMALLAMAGLFGFQKATTGDWRTPGHKVGLENWGRFGFGVIGGKSAHAPAADFKHRVMDLRAKKIIHTPAKGLEHTFLRLRALNDNLLGWPVPALFWVLLPFVLGRAGRNRLLLLLPLPALLFTYAGYWYYEICFPARYLSAALPILFILAARGWRTLQETLAGRGPWARLPAILAIWGTLFLAVSIPAHWRRYDTSYYDVEDVLPRVVRDYGIAHAIVFMDCQGREETEPDTHNDYYAAGFLRNDLDLKGDVLFVRNLRSHNILLARRHPDRACWLYRYHRGLDKAILYRLLAEGGELRAVPVEPATRDLLPAPEWPAR